MRHAESYLLVFAFILPILYYRLSCYKKQKALLFVSQGNIPYDIPQRSYFSFFVRCVCLLAAWVTLTICFAKCNQLNEQSLDPQNAFKTPQQLGAELPKIDEVAFILDLSASMGAKDASGDAERLVRAKEIISSLIEDLGGINASLTGFAGNTQTIVPDTLDYLYFRILMDSSSPNEMADAGTNLLAMVDAVKAKYVNSPYRKSVRVVLLTDGEDTGFLDMNASSQKQAEGVLLEHVAATVSDALRWDVIALGTDVGSEVPGVLYSGVPVVSQMKRSLLENVAKTGQGHFYAETDVSLIEICDDLLANIAGARDARVDQTMQVASVYAPQLSFEIVMLMGFASMLLFASLTLPQYERRAG